MSLQPVGQITVEVRVALLFKHLLGDIILLAKV